jgi:hypothetical protein
MLPVAQPEPERRYGAAVDLVPGLAAVAVCAAVFCPGAAAVDPNRLALMPLPRQALGPDAAGMSLVDDSGVDSNADAALRAGGSVTSAGLARAGRITGYTLDYARPLVGSSHKAHSLVRVQTMAELYRSEVTAAQGLTFWRGVTRALSGNGASGVTIGLSPFAARVGDRAFAFELTYRLAGKPVLYAGDVVFRSGDLLGAVFVTAGDRVGLRGRTAGLANRLAARIRHVIAGKIHGPPVALPPRK